MRVAVIGTGLMGASVALAARRRGDSVVGWDVDPGALSAAVAREALDAAGRHRRGHGAITDAGAPPVAIAPDAHDGLAAMTSHVPHVRANIVANQTGEARIEGHEPLAHAGGSLRDMTRIAGANPRIWVDIFLDNADALRDALAEHRRRVAQLERALGEGDAGFLARWIAEASGNRRRMLAGA